MLASNKPLFSIIMANYNNGHYIENAIKSLVVQTYKNWELIIVDDSSTDDSINIIKRISEKYNSNSISLFVNPKTMGVGYTKSQCVSFARGEYIGILDPDDELVENAIEIMIEYHLKNESASLIYSNCYICNESMTVQRIAQAKNIPRGYTMLEYWNRPGYSVSHFTSFKKYFYNKTAGFDCFMRIAEDKDIYYKMEEVGALLHIGEVLYKYRVHSGGLSIGKTSKYNLHWHFYALIKGFERRGLDFETMSFQFTQQYYTTNTIEYKVGSTILSPLKSLLKLFRKILQR